MATPCSPQALLNMQYAGCYACYDVHTIQTLIASFLCRIAVNLGAMATCDPATLVENAKCFACLTPQQLQVIQTQLLCDIYQNLGGASSGIGSIYCGDADPDDVTNAPTTACSFYYRTDNGAVWFWNSTNWVPLITA